MKRFILFSAFFLLLTSTGCGAATQSIDIPTREPPDYSVSADITEKAQDGSSPITDAQTEEVDLPPEGIDCFAVAEEYISDFQKLYRNYLQSNESELSFKIDADPSLRLFSDDKPWKAYVPVIDNEIKSYDDLKNLLAEHCTDEFAQELLGETDFRDFEGRLYRALENGRVDVGRSQFGCYIDNCSIDGNKMTVGFIKIGAENDNFDIDLERYCRMSTHDQPFEMTLVWKNGKWSVSGLGSSDPSVKGCPDPLGWADTIAFSYRPEITESMHETN